MSDLVTIQNIFVKLVKANPDFLFYHFGWLSDLDINIDNVFNQDAKKGRLFPCIDWIVPDNISFNINEPEKERVTMCLIFSDLQGYNNKGAQDNRTQLEVWRDLWKIAKPFILLFNRCMCEGGLGGLTEENINVELNSFQGKQRRQDITVKFNLILDSECIDIEGETCPTVTETCDLEDYCKCEENP